LAERVGFEPTNTREDVTGIPVQRLRPLGHLSIIFNKLQILVQVKYTKLVIRRCEGYVARNIR
jgi:hypothetical protein